MQPLEAETTILSTDEVRVHKELPRQLLKSIKANLEAPPESENGMMEDFIMTHRELQSFVDKDRIYLYFKCIIITFALKKHFLC